LPDKKIDIIIPAYHAHDTLPRTLASIASQTIVNDITVYVCNDAGGDNYNDIIKSFAPYVDIVELLLPENGGCGVARQYGIDHSTAPFFMCIDADDTLACPYTLFQMLDYINTEEKFIMVSGVFSEELGTPDGKLQFRDHKEDMIWMHGKLYRRSFIERHNIRFNETRSNEDNGFNTTIRLISNPNEKIMFIPDLVYYWHFKHDSITRVNNFEYTFNQSFVGYTQNMIHAVKRAREECPAEPKEINASVMRQINVWAMQVMAELYVYLEQTVHRDPRFITQNFGMCKKYYDEIFAPYLLTVPKDKLDLVFAQVIFNHAAENKLFTCSATMNQFLDQMKGAPVNEQASKPEQNPTA